MPGTYRPHPAERHVRILRAELTALAELAGTSTENPSALLVQIRARAAAAATSEWMEAKRQAERDRRARMVWDGKVWRDPEAVVAE